MGGGWDSSRNYFDRAGAIRTGNTETFQIGPDSSPKKVAHCPDLNYIYLIGSHTNPKEHDMSNTTPATTTTECPCGCDLPVPAGAEFAAPAHWATYRRNLVEMVEGTWATKARRDAAMRTLVARGWTDQVSDWTLGTWRYQVRDASGRFVSVANVNEFVWGDLEKHVDANGVAHASATCGDRAGETTVSETCSDFCMTCVLMTEVFEDALSRSQLLAPAREKEAARRAAKNGGRTTCDRKAAARKAVATRRANAARKAAEAAA